MLLQMIVLSYLAYGEVTSIHLRTSLCSAVDEENVEKVQELVDGGVDVNEACTFMKTDYPLLIAAHNGNETIGKLLLSNGADVNKAGFLGYTPLLRASEDIHPQFLELLLKHNADIHAKLLELKGLNFNLGLDALSLTTASYLRKIIVASTTEQQEMKESYAAILQLLFEHCFNFKKFGGVSLTRLDSEGFPDEAALVSELIGKENPSC
ncbi:Ankyrin repeat-containing domain [Trinorchestia longiramus]|nr:Ankyrin repeat-containing domain [Trinorchestia longiramus]